LGGGAKLRNPILNKKNFCLMRKKKHLCDKVTLIAMKRQEEKVQSQKFETYSGGTAKEKSERKIGVRQGSDQPGQRGQGGG